MNISQREYSQAGIVMLLGVISLYLNDLVRKMNKRVYGRDLDLSGGVENKSCINYCL